MIQQLISDFCRLFSRKKDAGTGKRRDLRTFKTRAAAKRRERAMRFFKRQG